MVHILRLRLTSRARPSQIVDESLGLAMSGFVVGGPKERRGMHCREHQRREGRRDELAAMPGDAECRAEQRLRRGGTEADDRQRLDQRDLGIEPRPAGRDLARFRFLVDAPLAARLPSEMLHHIGDVYLRAIDAGRVERAIEQPPAGPTNGWPAVLLSPGCSPTNISAPSAPSPNTVCVACSHRLQARQSALRTGQRRTRRELGTERESLVAGRQAAYSLMFTSATSTFRRMPAGLRGPSRSPSAPPQLVIGHCGERLHSAYPTPRAAATPDRLRQARRRSTGTLPGRCRSRRRARQLPFEAARESSPRCSIVR